MHGLSAARADGPVGMAPTQAPTLAMHGAMPEATGASQCVPRRMTREVLTKEPVLERVW
jgi:hypothetical protein